MTFWSWYCHSARTDGALVSAPRRVLGFSSGIVFLIGWYLSFALMSLRSIALEYLAYCVHFAQGVRLKWVVFFGIGEDELRKRYEESFGKDKFFRAPTLCAGLSFLVFACSGLTLVFTSQ
jgi:hypothetical protein